MYMYAACFCSMPLHSSMQKERWAGVGNGIGNPACLPSSHALCSAYPFPKQAAVPALPACHGGSVPFVLSFLSYLCPGMFQTAWQQHCSWLLYLLPAFCLLLPLPPSLPKTYSLAPSYMSWRQGTMSLSDLSGGELLLYRDRRREGDLSVAGSSSSSSPSLLTGLTAPSLSGSLGGVPCLCGGGDTCLHTACRFPAPWPLQSQPSPHPTPHYTPTCLPTPVFVFLYLEVGSG